MDMKMRESHKTCSNHVPTQNETVLHLNINDSTTESLRNSPPRPNMGITYSNTTSKHGTLAHTHSTYSTRQHLSKDWTVMNAEITLSLSLKNEEGYNRILANAGFT